MVAEYEIDVLFEEAQSRWLKPKEVLFILQNHEKFGVTQEPPQKPPSGSLFLFNEVLRFFRKDGYAWRKKKDGKTVGEAHERLKVGETEALNCYYAHGEQNPNFQRRSYWMLDPLYKHIVLVHYRDVSLTKFDLEWISTLPWLYHPRNRPFGDFKDTIGLVCALCQCIFAAVTYGFARQHTDSPIKVSFWPTVFASGLLLSKYFSKNPKRTIS